MIRRALDKCVSATSVSQCLFLRIVRYDRVGPSLTLCVRGFCSCMKFKSLGTCFNFKEQKKQFYFPRDKRGYNCLSLIILIIFIRQSNFIYNVVHDMSWRHGTVSAPRRFVIPRKQALEIFIRPFCLQSIVE